MDQDNDQPAQVATADDQPINVIKPIRLNRSGETSKSNSTVASPTKGSGTVTDDEDSRKEEELSQKELTLIVDQTREIQNQNEDEPEVTADEDLIAGTEQISEVQQPAFPTHMQARQSQGQVSYYTSECGMAEMLTFLLLFSLTFASFLCTHH